jgi:hypothetical protein
VRQRTDAARGQALVEFAMVLPLFLMITLAIVDFGMLLHGQQVTRNAAREGARLGAVGDVVSPKVSLSCRHVPTRRIVTGSQALPDDPASSKCF